MQLTGDLSKPVLRALVFVISFCNALALEDPFNPDPTYWRPPYGLRINSDDPRVHNALFTKDKLFTISAKADPNRAFTIYPSSIPFSPNITDITDVPDPGPWSRAELFQDKYHSSKNSSELILMWSNKPQKAQGTTPLVFLNTDTGPGLTHTWPATFYVRWGGWRFVWDEKANKTTLGEYFYDSSWRWILWQVTNDVWQVGRWDGTVPSEDKGWGNAISSVINNHIEVDVEVVPLWVLEKSGTLA
ncbi:hypothetical protein B0J11DRAFT_506536 [Dendryphion nanum]|uniref:Uncharacterized protein n=1 Tax=Dendryphion nanum TaxID=256645 RepID=A0A9P9IMA3_9PLEO|nr:hypothetical protein B0J11DRAFT_506536 [Dendryphion nanum]